MASTNSKKKHSAAAVKALDNAEAYFKLQKLDAAIKEATQAKNLDPNLPNVDNFITAYKIHKAMSSRKNWYVVLGIPECSNSLVVNRRYKELALMVHPDKNLSAAAEDAFKHVRAAMEFLSDPVKKNDYDRSFMSKKKPYVYVDPAKAAAAARKAAEAAAAKEAAEAAAAKEAAARRDAAAREAAERRRAALEAELAAAARKIAEEAAAASRKAAEEAASASRRAAEAAAASWKAAATPLTKEAAAAARNTINARKHHAPMSELEYGIHLLMKYSSNYMERKFSVW